MIEVGKAMLDAVEHISESAEMYKEIKAEDVTVEEANNFWDNEFENLESRDENVTEDTNLFDKEEGFEKISSEQLDEAAKENLVENFQEIKNEDISVKEANNFWDNEFENLGVRDEDMAADIKSFDETEKNLTDEQKKQIKEITGWSDEIIDAIGSWEEYEIYKNAGLNEAEIGGRKCLIRDDIDWKQKDDMGRTNEERAKQGLSPINKDGKVIELHHIGQHADSPLAELTPEEHRGRGNDTVLHDKTKVSEIDRQAFADERSEHWEARANDGGN